MTWILTAIWTITEKLLLCDVWFWGFRKTNTKFLFFIQKGWALTMIKKLTCFKIAWGIYSLLFIALQYQSCGKMSLLPFSRCNESNELIGQKLLQPWLQYVVKPHGASKYSGLPPSHTLFINSPVYGFPFTANIAM